MYVLFFIGTIAIATMTLIERTSASEIPMEKRLKVTVFYESNCPSSTSFITKQLKPNFCKVQQYLKLKLVPFGNSFSLSNGFFCQHGQLSCRSNIIQNCALKRIKDPVLQVDYVNCTMFNPKKTGLIELLLCAAYSGADAMDVNNCLISKEGNDLMLKAEKETKRFALEYIPTTIFDDKYNTYDQNRAFIDFETMVCEKLANRGYTDVCSNGKIKNPQKC